MGDARGQWSWTAAGPLAHSRLPRSNQQRAGHWQLAAGSIQRHHHYHQAAANHTGSHLTVTSAEAAGLWPGGPPDMEGWGEGLGLDGCCCCRTAAAAALLLLLCCFAAAGKLLC